MFAHMKLLLWVIHLSVLYSRRKSGRDMNIDGICFGGILLHLVIRMLEHKEEGGVKNCFRD